MNWARPSTPRPRPRRRIEPNGACSYPFGQVPPAKSAGSGAGLATPRARRYSLGPGPSPRSSMSESLPLQLRIHGAIREVPRAAWDALLDDASTPFVEWAWLDGAGAERLRQRRGGLAPAPLHALARLAPGGRRARVPQGRQPRRVRLRLVLGHRRRAAGHRATTPSWCSPRPSLPPPASRVLVAPGEDRAAPRGASCSPGRWSSPGRRGCPRSTSSSTPRPSAAAWRRPASRLRLGVQYQWRNAGYRTLGGLPRALPLQAAHPASPRAARPGGAGPHAAHPQRRGAGRAGPGRALPRSTPPRWTSILGPPPPHGGLLRAACSPPSATACEVVEARKDGRLVAGAFNLASPQRALWPVLGLLRGTSLPALQRLPVLPGGGVHRLGAEPLRAGRGRGAQAGRGFEPALTYSAHLIVQPGARPGQSVISWLQERTAIQQGLPRWRAETGFKGGLKRPCAERLRSTDGPEVRTGFGTSSQKPGPRRSSRSRTLYKVLLAQRQLHHARIRGRRPARRSFTSPRRKPCRSCCTFITTASAWRAFIRMKSPRRRSSKVEALARENGFPLAPVDGTGGRSEPWHAPLIAKELQTSFRHALDEARSACATST